jgi:dTDP-4-amino-4,6-dideoxygalactose transaminase
LSPGAFEVRGELARAAELAASEVSLPVHPYLDDAEVTRVIDAVNGWESA